MTRTARGRRHRRVVSPSTVREAGRPPGADARPPSSGHTREPVRPSRPGSHWCREDHRVADARVRRCDPPTCRCTEWRPRRRADRIRATWHEPDGGNRRDERRGPARRTNRPDSPRLTRSTSSLGHAGRGALCDPSDEEDHPPGDESHSRPDVGEAAR